ncbi:hypothetical protein EVAR_80867_1 [Eumeta japonica]|uniref:Uncharacterized protein n=1 Tax=Eumeta variegata TaxID=151549 RepID=A0A4C1V043_EUMVA|nr:hypothetical protein EVAR_80867_1 [Eumeta japonica]
MDRNRNRKQERDWSKNETGLETKNVKSVWNHKQKFHRTKNGTGIGTRTKPILESKGNPDQSGVGSGELIHKSGVRTRARGARVRDPRQRSRTGAIVTPIRRYGVSASGCDVRNNDESRFSQ